MFHSQLIALFTSRAFISSGNPWVGILLTLQGKELFQVVISKANISSHVFHNPWPAHLEKIVFAIIVSGSWLPSPPGPCPPRWVYCQLELFPPKRRSAVYLESAISSLHFLEGWCTQDCSSCRQCRRGRAAQSSRPLVRLSWSPERKADCAHNLCSARPMIKGYMEHCRDVKEMHIKFVREQKQVNFVKIKWKGKGNPCLFKSHFLQRKPVLSGGGPSSLQRGKSLTCKSLVRKKNPNLPRRPGQVSHEEVFDCIERANQSCVRSNSRWRSRPASMSTWDQTEFNIFYGRKQ